MTSPGFTLGNLAGRASVLRDGRAIDVERRSDGRFRSDPMAVMEDWAAFCAWADAQRPRATDPVLDEKALGPCVPRPSQVFAVGMNFRDHAAEVGLPEPKQPVIFTKFPSCLSGPRAPVELSSSSVDYEVELVVVMGETADCVEASQALDHVAGYCVGQDISDRELQFADSPPQFSLGKSQRGYGPIGPWLTPRAAVELSQLTLRCEVSGECLQQGRVSDMFFSVPQLVAFLSRSCRLLPGDLIFSGTPSGVGVSRKPPRFLRDGDVIVSEIAGLGRLQNRCAARG